MAQAAGVSPDDLIARGRASYDAGRYADAARDLSAAADAIVTPAQMQQYVTGGKFESLPKFETAIIYLALSYAKLGRDADAREQIQRLVAAETIAPTYGTLTLDADAAGFEDLVRRLSPATSLPMKTTAVATVAPPPVAPPPPAATATQTTTLTPEQQRELDQRIANARAEAEKEAEQRIATERAAIQKQMEERIAAERAAADARVAAERVAIERQMEQQIAAIRAAAAEEVAHAAKATVRRAEGMAIAGDVEDANAMFARLLKTPNPPRELVAQVATGFYRTGDYPGALRAFDKLGTFARGEEDLRYYKAVALYETGRYGEAKKELECALPFIELTDEVNRYRDKIEQMP